MTTLLQKSNGDASKKTNWLQLPAQTCFICDFIIWDQADYPSFTQFTFIGKLPSLVQGFYWCFAYPAVCLAWQNKGPPAVA